MSAITLICLKILVNVYKKVNTFTSLGSTAIIVN